MYLTEWFRKQSNERQLLELKLIINKINEDLLTRNEKDFLIDILEEKIDCILNRCLGLEGGKK